MELEMPTTNTQSSFALLSLTWLVERQDLKSSKHKVVAAGQAVFKGQNFSFFSWIENMGWVSAALEFFCLLAEASNHG